MQQIIGVTELQRKFRSFFELVVNKGQPIILTRGSRPEAVLIPYEDYERYQQLQENEILVKFDAVWEKLDNLNASYSDAEIKNDIENARQD